MEQEPPQQTPFQVNQYIPPSRNSRKNLKRFILILIIFLGLTIFGITRFLSSRESSQSKVIPTPTVEATPTEELFPTDTPMLTSTPAPSLKPTSAQASDPKDKTTGLDRSNLSIEVQNGSGVVGAANKASDFLKSLGYVVSSTANADTFDYQETVIRVKSEKEAYLPLLKKDIGTNYTIGEASESLSASTSADAIVIVGKQ